VEIHPSGRRHGIADDDILHAIEHSLVVDELAEDPDLWLVIGPDRASNLLEVVVLVTAEGDGTDHPRNAPPRRLPETARAMTKRTYGHTASGKPIDDKLINTLADEAEAGYDVNQIIIQRGKRGRPSLGHAPSTVESVRLDPELKQRLARRAQDEGIPASEVIREALRHHLETS